MRAAPLATRLGARRARTRLLRLSENSEVTAQGGTGTLSRERQKESTRAPTEAPGEGRGQLLPKKVEALAGQRVIAVSAGEYHSLTIAVWSWGGGAWGKLGDGDQQNQTTTQSGRGMGAGAVRRAYLVCHLSLKPHTNWAKTGDFGHPSKYLKILL